MRGTLIYVMGPSGSGKDSLLSALRPRLRGLPVAFARRYISRPACAGGEQHMALSAGSILSMEAQGRLAMRWSSHGSQYGIGRSIDGSLEHGICVIVNGSREYLPEALRRYPDLLPVLVEVEPAILRQRLLARGREQGKDLEERLQRALAPFPASWKRRSMAWRISCGLSCRCAACRAPPRERRAALPEANLLSESEKRAPSLWGKSPFAVHVVVPYAQPACFHARGTTRACAGQMRRKLQRLR